MHEIICGNSYECYEIVKCCLSELVLVNTLNKITCYRWQAENFLLTVNVHSFVCHYLSILHHCLTFSSVILFWPHTMFVCVCVCVCVKKVDNSANFAAGGIVNCRTHNSHCRENKHFDALQGSYSCDATSHARAKLRGP
jgi:hypothetical protein